eukprot:1690868-Pleurochrysis_carterae.AAC.1
MLELAADEDSTDALTHTLALLVAAAAGEPTMAEEETAAVAAARSETEGEPPADETQHRLAEAGTACTSLMLQPTTHGRQRGRKGGRGQGEGKGGRLSAKRTQGRERAKTTTSSCKDDYFQC